MEWMVSCDESGLRLVDFVSQRHSGSKRAIRRALERNGCLVNGRVERFGSVKLQSGDKVSFRDPESDTAGRYAFEESRVLFEDDYLMIYDKPAGISVERLQPLLSGGWQMLHRLDRYTTGAWVLARAGAIAKLELQFRRRKVKKRYLALVDGVPEESRGVLEGNIKGKPARTRWQLQAVDTDRSVLSCEPETGRMHQIRIHLARMGHPLLGDRDYASSFSCSDIPEHYCLHAEKVTFEHPLTGEEIIVKAPVPRAFGR